MSSTEDPAIVTSTRSPAGLSPVPEHGRPGGSGDPWLRIDTEGAAPSSAAVRPGHGRTTSLRRQLAWSGPERMARPTGVFEIICCECGDHPYLDYAEISPRLQRIRGPYTLAAGVAAFAEHVGLAPGPHQARPGRPDPDAAMPADPDIVTSARSPAGQSTVPRARQPGHGRTTFLRRRPVRIVEGRIEGGYTRVFEIICPSCGDHPYLDFAEVSPRLRWLRGPYTLKVGLAAYEEHLGDHGRETGREHHRSHAGAQVGASDLDGTDAAERGGPCSMLGEPLTEREVRVLRLLRGSLTQSEIAAELGLSPNTIKTRTQAIYRKLGVRTRQDAITQGQLIGILNSAAAASLASCLCEPDGSEGRPRRKNGSIRHSVGLFTDHRLSTASVHVERCPRALPGDSVSTFPAVSRARGARRRRLARRPGKRRARMAVTRADATPADHPPVRGGTLRACAPPAALRPSGPRRRRRIRPQVAGRCLPRQ
jgi:DNA-binding CsgD family transcriptional regulator